MKKISLEHTYRGKNRFDHCKNVDEMIWSLSAEIQYLLDLKKLDTDFHNTEQDYIIFSKEAELNSDEHKKLRLNGFIEADYDEFDEEVQHLIDKIEKEEIKNKTNVVRRLKP